MVDNCYSYQIPLLGWVTIGTAVQTVAVVSFAPAPESVEQKETALIREVYRQLAEYCKGTRCDFDLPLDPRGTTFQKSVWQALRAIPYGQTKTYGQIAAAIGNPNACRAVGMANNRNPLPILIPCHRVIGADGGLIGYAGGLAIKQKLLDLERGILGAARRK